MYIINRRTFKKQVETFSQTTLSSFLSFITFVSSFESRKNKTIDPIDYVYWTPNQKNRSFNKVCLRTYVIQTVNQPLTYTTFKTWFLQLQALGDF